MGSLSDSLNVGATPADTQRFYGAERVGRGRWAILPGLGVLWTDDDDALQLAWIEGSDNDAAYGMYRRLNGLAAAGVPASRAFDDLIAEFPGIPVQSGDLASLR
nr:hypothetical protein [Rhodococcus sp. 15-649-1-2]